MLSLGLQILGRVILVLASFASVSVTWWAPLVVAPVCWQAWGNIVGKGKRIESDVLQLIANLVLYVIDASYFVAAIVSFGNHVGQWYGCTLGVVAGFAVAHLFGLLHPHRWHVERMDQMAGR